MFGNSLNHRFLKHLLNKTVKKLIFKNEKIVDYLPETKVGRPIRSIRFKSDAFCKRMIKICFNKFVNLYT